MFPPDSAFAKVKVLQNGGKLGPNQIALMLLEDIENEEVEAVTIAIRWKSGQLSSAFSTQSLSKLTEAITYLQAELHHALWGVHNAGSPRE